VGLDVWIVELVPEEKEFFIFLRARPNCGEHDLRTLHLVTLQRVETLERPLASASRLWSVRH